MIDNELKELWQSPANEEQVKFDKSRLIKEMNHNLGAFDKTIRNRDLLEILASLTIIPVFIFYAYQIPYVSTKIGSVLIALWAVFVIIKLRRAQKNRPRQSISKPYLDYLRESKAYLEQQKKLLTGILGWYLSPFLMGMILFVSGFLREPNQSTYVASMVVFFVLLTIGIYYANQWAANHQIQPKIDEVDHLISSLKEDYS